ncbi:MAG: hypothetical protein PVJ43_13805, partial [Gemmatimonadales bacterium]
MWRKLHRLARATAPCWLGSALWLVPASSLAQSDATAPTDSVAPVGATLRRWDENRWLTIFDRSGAYFGRV